MKRELRWIYLALKHPQTPWYAKALAVLVIAYALSPIDLIPDPIPLLGYLDDLILVPLGVAAVRKLVPDHVMRECRAADTCIQSSFLGHVGAAAIVTVWLVATVACGWWFYRTFV